MITAIRSIVFCDKVERDEKGISYIGLQGEVMTAESIPGFIDTWIAIVLDVNGKVSPGRLIVETEGYSESFPFSTPPGIGMTAIALPLIIPVLKNGSLRIAIQNDPGKAIRTTWKLAISPNAKTLEKDVAERLMQLPAKSADEVRKGAGTKH